MTAPIADTEIAEALGVEVLARLPWDPDAAEALVSVPASARELRLAPLVRAARTLADQLATELSSGPASTDDAVTAEPEHPVYRWRFGVGCGERSRPGDDAPPSIERERARGGVAVSADTVAGGRSAGRGPGRALGARAGAGRRRPSALSVRPTSRPSVAS